VFGHRTISKSGFDRLCRIPSGTEAVLFDDNREMATQMVSVLWQIGVRHLRLTSASLENPEACNGKTVILLGESGYVPVAPREIVKSKQPSGRGTIIDWVSWKLTICYGKNLP
jgi:hypothetical protein